MAHYNIYEDLGIDRSLESSGIVSLIDERLASTPHGNSADYDRLITSRRLFEDDSRRSAYDKALDDPNHPDITIGTFRSFADGTNSTPTSSQPSAPHSAFSAAPSSSISTPTSPARHSAPEHPNSSASASQQHNPWNFNQGNHSSANTMNTHIGSMQNNQTGINTAEPVPISLDLRALAVSPERKRTQSLMWLIGWGLITIPWLVFPFIYFFGGPDDSAGFFETLDHEAMLAGTLAFAILNTIALLIVLNFVWHLRVYLGRKLK